MLSREENELLTRTGPGTPLGEVMRRYWIPALLSWELAEPDGPPARVTLLGEKEERSLEHQDNGPSHVDQTTFRSHRNKRNDWLLDRHVQKYETFSGIEGISTQDRATQESMGPIVDRAKEHLGPADQAIIVGRKVLLEAIRTVQDGGTPPGTGTSYYTILGMEGMVPKDVEWREAVMPNIDPVP